MAKKTPTEETPPFEHSIAELERIVKRLETGGSSLDDDLTDYARAIQLIKQCHMRLSEAERTVQLLTGIDAEGKPVTQSFTQGETSGKSLEDKQIERSRRRSATHQDDSLF